MGSSRYVWELSRAALADRDGLVVVIKIFMDESGTHDQSPAMAIGAYLAPLETWEAFTTKWNDVKRHEGKYPIDVFHSTDCEALRGEFEGWTKVERDGLVSKLLSVIGEHDIHGIGLAVDLPSFKSEFKNRPDLRALFNDEPYIFCFQLVLDDILSELEKSGSNQAVAFVHEENEYEAMAEAAFSSMKAQRSKHYGPMSLTFGEKRAYTPLQAADVLAFETNKRMRDPSKEGRRSFQTINARGRVRVEGFTRENMPKLIKRLDLIAQELKIFGRMPRL